MKSNDLLSAYPGIRRKIAHRSVRILILSVLWVGAVTLFETMFFHDYLTGHRVPLIPAVLIWLILALVVVAILVFGLGVGINSLMDW